MDYAECKRRVKNIDSYLDEIIRLQNRILTIQDTQIKNMDRKARKEFINNISLLEGIDFYASSIDERARLIYNISGQVEDLSTQQLIEKYGPLVQNTTINRTISYLSTILKDYYESLHNNGSLKDILGKARDDLQRKLNILETYIQLLSSFTFNHASHGDHESSLGNLRAKSNKETGYRVYYLKAAHKIVKEIESIMEQRYNMQFKHGENFIDERNEHPDDFIRFIFIFLNDARKKFINNSSLLQGIDLYRLNIDERAKLIYNISGSLQDQIAQQIIDQYKSFVNDSSMNKTITYLSIILEEYYQILDDNGKISDMFDEENILRKELDQLKLYIQHLSSFTFEHLDAVKFKSSLVHLQIMSDTKTGYRVYYLKAAHDVVKKIETIMEQIYNIQSKHGDNFFDGLLSNRNNHIHFIFVFN